MQHPVRPAERFARGLLDLWAEEGGECPHGHGFDADCPGETCESCSGSGERPDHGMGAIEYLACLDCEGKGSACRHDALRPVLRAALAYIEGKPSPPDGLLDLLVAADAEAPDVLIRDIDALYQ